jgi:hypothetical protein
MTLRTGHLCSVSLLLAIAVPCGLYAQGAAAPDSVARPAAVRADVESIGAIMSAVYDVISGPAGPRNWQRFYSLFAPDARLIPTRHDSSGTHLHTMTPEQFVQRTGQILEHQGFFEREIGRETNSFGAVTQVFSAYASRHAPDDPKPFARGINSFQLFNDGTRWYIVTIYWAAETPNNPIPDRYLHVAR